MKAWARKTSLPPPGHVPLLIGTVNLLIV